jgi:hypothetical protein
MVIDNGHFISGYLLIWSQKNSLSFDRLHEVIYLQAHMRSFGITRSVGIPRW